MSVMLRIVDVVRWIARMWACLVAFIVVMILIVPDPNASPGGVADLPLIEIIGLGLYILSALGLLLAWRLELISALIAIAGVVGHDIAFYVRMGFSPKYLAGNGTVGLVFIIPAVLFILCWGFSRKKQKGSDLPVK